MAKVVLALGAVTLLLCIGFPLETASKAQRFEVSRILAKDTEQVASSDKFSGAMIAPQIPFEISDSDEFFQKAVKEVGPERDNTQKIEALLKRMTLEEKVGQMTQLAISMVASGSDQN